MIERHAPPARSANLSVLSLRRILLGISSSAALIALAYGCSASNDGNVGPASGGGSGGISEAGLAEVVLESAPASQDDGSLRLNALCGLDPLCVPDDYLACASYVLPLAPGAGGSAGSEAGAAGDGGSGPVANTGSGLGGNMSGTLPDDAGASGAEAQGGVSGADVPSRRFGCQVQRSPAVSTAVVSQCGVVGLGGSNAPCLTSGDCQAGFGCVGDQGSGLCQRYCCRDADACGPGTYCAERPLRDALVNAQGSAANALSIPVCVPAENCDLGAPYPCPSGAQCTCKKGTACLVVRADGTTTCAVPGTGKVGNACPCAWGHVCSAATDQCLKLCYTRDAAPCGNGKCQSAAELPDGWGVCVGG